MNVGKCDLTLFTITFIFCSIKIKANSQITISTSFTSLWGKIENFKSADFYFQSMQKFAYEHLDYEESPAEDRLRRSKLKLLVYYRIVLKFRKLLP
jgi:hypothetical protein